MSYKLFNDGFLVFIIAIAPIGYRNIGNNRNAAVVDIKQMVISNIITRHRALIFFFFALSWIKGSDIYRIIRSVRESRSRDLAEMARLAQRFQTATIYQTSNRRRHNFYNQMTSIGLAKRMVGK